MLREGSNRCSPLGQGVLLHRGVGAEAMLRQKVLAMFPDELVYALPPPLGMSVAVTLQNQRPVRTHDAQGRRLKPFPFNWAAPRCLSMLVNVSVPVIFYLHKK